MSTWVRRWLVPRATHSRIRLPARSSVDSGKCGRMVLSVSMRLMRVGPAACPIHGRPGSVLSRCMSAIDQSRQYEIAADVERRRTVRQCGRRALTDDRDLSVGNADIDKTTIGKAAIGQDASAVVIVSFLAS